MWFNDDDIEKGQHNWKNSEVTRIFVDEYINPLLEKEAADKVAAEMEENVVVEAEDDPEVVLANPREVEMKAAVQSVIDKLATLSNQYGNEKVRYKIERTIMELEDIRKNGE